MYGSTREITLNNPMGLKKSDSAWLGKIIPSPDPVFESFITALDGMRAGAKNISGYLRLHGCKTLAEFIACYAPPSDDNPTASYLGFLCSRCGVEPDEPVNLADPEFLGKLVPAIITFENGDNPYPQALIAQAITEALVA